MENTKVLRIIFLALFFLIIPVCTFAYSVDTHAFLTNETISFYNQSFTGNQIPDEIRDFLIDGSRHEESFPRWMNHFYDPVNNRGLETAMRSGYTSPAWAISTEKQNEAKYKITTAIASILTAVKERRISALTTETDFTWNRAKRFYLTGDKEKAMYLLGHTLHLIQDASVPAKTRNNLILKSDEMTYESWAEKFTLNTKDFTLPKRLEPRGPFVLNDLQSHFYELALYSNNNFFSKNTIGIQSYSKPTSAILEKDQGYWFRFGYDEEFGKYHLVWEKSPGNHNFLVNFKKNLSLYDKHKLIFRDYWSLLSTKAVQHGAGMIDLFFREVKAIEENPVRLAEFLSEEKEKKSFLSRTGNAIKEVVSGATNLIKETFAPDGSFKGVEEISLLEDTSGEADLTEDNSVEKETVKFCSFDNASKVSQTTPLIINEVAWMGDNNDFRHEWIELKNISEEQVNIGGYQIIDKKEQIQFVFPSGITLSPGDFYLIEHSNDSSAPPQADGIYQGSLSNSNEELKLFDINCNVLDAVSADSSWPAGDNGTKQTMERGSMFSWHNSSEPGGTPKKENSRQNVNSEVFIKSTVERGETIAESGANFTPGGKVKLHFILPNGNKAITEIIADKNGTFEKIYTMPKDALLGDYVYYAVDVRTGTESNKVEYSVTEQEESASTETTVSEEGENIMSSLCSYQTSEPPSQETLIINEVAWMGSKENYRNEWIELRNISDSRIDLSGYQLIDRDDQIHITFATTTIPAGGFILLERNNNDSVSSKTADIIYTGSLKNSDEGLRLFDGNCNLLDEAVADPDWPKGSNNSKKTMERKDDLNWQTSNDIGGTPGEKNSTVTVYHGGGGGGSGTPTPSNDDSDGGDNENEVISCLYETNQSPDSSNIIINELAWMGTDKSSDDEWIELKNVSDFEIDLSGYQLIDKDDQIHVTFSTTTVSFGDFILLERTDDDSVPGKTADIIYTGSLKNSDEGLRLFDNSCNLLDEAIADPDWPKGNNDTKQTMERKSDLSWQTSDDVGGTPGESNSTPADFQTDNKMPTASFSYSPSEPKVGEIVSFDASSSTDDGEIVSYQWDFGDDGFASNSIATTTHIYTSSGSYSISLTVFDSENSSSTIIKLISIASVAASGTEANHIVISEVMPGVSGEADKEFIELYNPTDKEVNLTGWSLERNLSWDTTSTETLVEKISTSSIPAKGFYLIGSQDYSKPETNKTDETYTYVSYYLTYNNDGVILYNGLGREIDETFYNSVPGGKSWERKTFDNGSCYTAQDDYEFKGNSCSSTNSFSVRDNPNPQNLLSLPEPRNAPTSTEEFSAEYDEENLKISFDWGTYKDFAGSTSTVSYEIKEYNSPGVVIHNSTIIGHSKNIDEVGRDYTFSFQAFDKDGLGSAMTTSTISVPSLINDFYIYKDPRVSPSNTYLAEFYYPRYPFIPDLYQGGDNQTRKMVVLYLNKEAPAENSFTLQGGGYGWKDLNNPDVVYTKFKHCTSGERPEKAVLFSDISGLCTNAGTASAYSLNYEDYSLGEDNHLLIKLASSVSDLNLDFNSDYFTLAFYGYNTSSADRRKFKLVAIDKTKYHFQSSPPEQSSPKLEGPISTTLNDAYTRLLTSWKSATDLDTIDNKITYEISYSTTTEIGNNWQDVGTKENYQRQVSPDDKFLIAVRAKDDFGNTSNILTISWSYFIITPILAQTQFDGWSDGWGNVNQKTSEYQPASFQSITPENGITFNKFITKLKMKKRGGGPSYDSNLRLSVLSSVASDTPDFRNVIAEAVKGPIFNPNANEDFAFTFNNSVNLQAGVKYWLVLDSPGPQDALFDNKWFNAIKTGDSAYENGEAGRGKYKGKNNTCDNSCVFSGNYSAGPADWYFKLISD